MSNDRFIRPKVFEVMYCAGKCLHGVPSTKCDGHSDFTTAVSRDEACIKVQLDLDTRWPTEGYLVNWACEAGIICPEPMCTTDTERRNL